MFLTSDANKQKHKPRDKHLGFIYLENGQDASISKGQIARTQFPFSFACAFASTISKNTRVKETINLLYKELEAVYKTWQKIFLKYHCQSWELLSYIWIHQLMNDVCKPSHSTYNSWKRERAGVTVIWASLFPKP